MALVYNEAILLRYVYICCLGTVGSIDEDLLGSFLAALNAVVGAAVAAWSQLWLGDAHIVFAVCAGRERNGNLCQ